MRITFDVGDSTAEFHREPFLGRTTLLVDGQKTTLASLVDPSTSFTYTTLQKWRLFHGQRTVEIDKRRPQMFGGLRRSTYVVRVDGQEITTLRGY